MMLDPPLYRMVAQAQQEDVRREAEWLRLHEYQHLQRKTARFRHTMPSGERPQQVCL
jgi:hypothetical protein